MGVFCLLYMMTKRYPKSYTFVCSWMCLPVCTVGKVRDRRQPSSSSLSTVPLRQSACEPGAHQFGCTVWLEATSVLPHPGATLHGCWNLDSGPHASNPPLPTETSPSPSYILLERHFYVVITRNHNSQLKPRWPTCPLRSWECSYEKLSYSN